MMKLVPAIEVWSEWTVMANCCVSVTAEIWLVCAVAERGRDVFGFDVIHDGGGGGDDVGDFPPHETFLRCRD